MTLGTIITYLFICCSLKLSRALVLNFCGYFIQLHTNIFGVAGLSTSNLYYLGKKYGLPHPTLHTLLIALLLMRFLLGLND